MSSSLRPRGTVEVTCQHRGCGWSWWVDPLDSRLPDGPWDCGDDHEGTRTVRRAFSRLRLETGIHWGSMSGRGPEFAGEGCGGTRSHRAGVAGVLDRLRGRRGLLEWSSLAELEHTAEMVARIRWGEFLETGGELGVAKDPYAARPGHVQTVGYRWRGSEIRRYTFVKCARGGCPHHVMVDYDRPSMNCRGGASYEVGSWGGAELPEPRWWGKTEVRCGDGLGTFAPYPCRIVHTSEVLAAVEAEGLVWTMWAQNPNETGDVLFYDREVGVHGLLTYSELPGNELPMEFMSVSTLKRCIHWGNLLTLHTMLANRPNDLTFELAEYLR